MTDGKIILTVKELRTTMNKTYPGNKGYVYPSPVSQAVEFFVKRKSSESAGNIISPPENDGTPMIAVQGFTPYIISLSGKYPAFNDLGNFNDLQYLFFPGCIVTIVSSMVYNMNGNWLIDSISTSRESKSYQTISFDLALIKWTGAAV